MAEGRRRQKQQHEVGGVLIHHQRRALVPLVCTQKENYVFKAGLKPKSRNNRLVYLSLQSPSMGRSSLGTEWGMSVLLNTREAASIPAPAWAQLSLLAVLT